VDDGLDGLEGRTEPPAGEGARSQGVRVVGLTGGIASGKSTVRHILEGLGAPTLSSDAVAREVVRPGQPAWEAVVAAFGSEVLRADGQLDRRRLAEFIFADPARRRQLEAATHPAIRERTLAWVEAQRHAGALAVVCEIPLLFEVGLDRPGSFVDRIWVVQVRPEVQWERLRRRDGLSEAEARARLASQWPLAVKAAAAHRVIDNNGSLEQLREVVAAAWRELLAEVAAESGAAPS